MTHTFESPWPHSLPAVVARRAQETPDRIFAQEVEGAALTYGSAHEAALERAGALAQLGVGRGDHVMTMLPPSVDATVSWLALSWLGAVDVSTNTDYLGDMLAHVVTSSRSKVIVVAERYVQRLAAIRDVLDLVETIIIPDGSADIDLPQRVVDRDELLSLAERLPQLEPPAPWETAGIIYTSGTTGRSKPVILPWAHMYAFVLRSKPQHEYTEDDVFYAPYPMFHLSGRLPPYHMALSGGRYVVREKFSGTAFWDDVRRFGCTTCMLVGSMPHFLASQEPRPDDADNPLRMVSMTPVLPDFEDFKRRFGIERLDNMYGMTEVGTPIYNANVTDYRSAGKLLEGWPHFEVRIVDENDCEVPAGVRGECVLRTSVPWTITPSYFGMPEETANTFRNGWFHTGDAMMKDEEGNFYFLDRIKDALRRRGELISSQEVEAHVNEHPAVSECACVAAPSEWGEDEVKVVVVLQDGESVEPDALIDFLEDRMPRFMVPRYLEFVAELPKTQANARVRKAVLRENAINDNTWDRDAARGRSRVGSSGRAQ